MRTNKEKFDLIISLGAACSCTQTLRALNLQDYSYPFDWMYGTDFYGRCKILADNFYRFIKKEDLIFKEKAESINRDIYYNEYNKLTFNHDFISGVEFNKMYKEVEEKYKRRINRLLKKIKKSKKILMVYIETPDKKSPEADNSIIKGYNFIKEKFNKKQIKLLYFFNNEIKGGGEPCSLSSDIKKIILNYKDKNPNNPSYSVDFNALIKELSIYSLKRPFYKKAAIFITRVFINLIPTKNVRRKLKNKFHIKKKYKIKMS